MPKPGHNAMVGDVEDVSSGRRRMRRWSTRELKNHDIAVIVFDDKNYLEYDEPIVNAEHYTLAGAAREVEKQRYSLAIANYQMYMDELDVSRKKLFSTMMGLIAASPRKK